MRDMMLCHEERAFAWIFTPIGDIIFSKTSALFSAEFWAKNWLLLVPEAVA